MRYPQSQDFRKLFLIRDTIDYVSHTGLSAAIISLDQEKAFDQVNHGFLQRVLERFNFGPHFRRWVTIAYTDIKFRVINNGWVSSAIALERGVRQGCLLSPLLYCLVVETLGQAIRNDKSIEGIQIPGARGEQSKVSQYADDTTLILANDFSINKAFNIITTFEHATGSCLYAQKTEVTLSMPRGSGTQRRSYRCPNMSTRESLKLFLTSCGTVKPNKLNALPAIFLSRKVASPSLTRPKKQEPLNSGGFPASVTRPVVLSGYILPGTGSA